MTLKDVEKSYPSKTNDDGLWEIKDLIIMANAQYDLKINFMNAAS